ncbi:amino acid adenylation domain-containing protein [uncultured Kordia sp.]|uniref:non-ribosomal peptide synthetase n=1 Tax=uncultured Kordia sp. TaxID=507699 RepID=UPI002611B9E0|nr:amino acid adenylation domain-containing protein [uncultured Kordia sp.]
MDQLVNKLYQLGIRIEAKNGELQVKAPKNTLTPELIQEIKQQKEDLIAILGNPEIEIPKAPIQEYYPLTAAQKRIWILSQFEGGSKAYNIFGAFEMEGQLDMEALQKASKFLIERHESLRTKFIQKDGDIWQKILPVAEINFSVDVLPQTTDVTSVIAEFYETEFDLTQAPLLKAQVIPVTPTKHILVFAIHHIIGDGWSMEIFSGELIKSYNDIHQNQEITLPELTIQYKDYAFWMESDVMQEKLNKQEAYWLSEFSGELPKMTLPTYQPRPSINGYEGDVTHNRFSIAWSDAVKKMAEKEEATLFMMLMAGINGILYRYAGNSDIILGVPTSGRGHSAVKNQIGLYLNTLAIRTQLNNEMSLRELIKLQKQKLIDAYTNEMYPFDQLVEKLKLERDASRTALFDVMVVLQNQQNMTLQESKSFEGITINPYNAVTPKVSLFDMTFSFSEYNGHIELALEYNTDLYEETFVKQLIQHFENLLADGIKNPKTSVDTLQILSENEQQNLLTNNTVKLAYNATQTITDMFETSVEKYSSHTALIVDDSSLTYAEMNAEINQFAQYLAETFKIKKGDFVGVKLERNQQLPIAILAVMKLGATYVPIDTAYPEERIQYIQNDSNCTCVIDQKVYEDFLPEQAKFSTENLQVNIDAAAVAYIIYTSGTTGKPKGVMITHKNAMAMLAWAKEEFKTTNFDTAYAVTSHCFDLSIYELFFPLSVGKTIRLLPNALAILDTVAKDKNILINTVPSSMRSLLESNMSFDNVRMVNLAGEAFPVDIAEKLLKTNAEIRNLYGPSEDTTYSTVYKLDAAKSYKNSIPIGKPIANTTAYILDKNLQLVPTGVVGRLYITGDGVAKGYLGKDAITQEKFIENPFKKGTLMYDTGDIASWQENGNIMFLGREDNQVKIRGYRIELEEIETAIRASSEHISQVVVLVKKYQQHDTLVAYYTEKEAVDTNIIKSNLAETLPSYMIPNHIEALDEIPLTPNGKIDRKALEKLKISLQANIEYVAPKNEIEEALAEIWKEVLGVEKVGVTNNFFELGGHSLLAITLINEINKKFDKTNFHIRNLFKNSTIESMAALIAIAERKTMTDDLEDEDTENFVI